LFHFHLFHLFHLFHFIYIILKDEDFLNIKLFRKWLLLFFWNKK
jgi:hypothetical protein